MIFCFAGHSNAECPMDELSVTIYYGDEYPDWVISDGNFLYAVNDGNVLTKIDLNDQTIVWSKTYGA